MGGAILCGRLCSVRQSNGGDWRACTEYARGNPRYNGSYLTDDRADHDDQRACTQTKRLGGAYFEHGPLHRAGDYDDQAHNYCRSALAITHIDPSIDHHILYHHKKRG